MQKNDVLLNFKAVTGNDGSYEEIKSTGTTTSNSVSIPVIAKYSFMQKDLSPFASLGLAYEIRTSTLLSTTETVNDYDGSKGISRVQTVGFTDKIVDGFPTTGMNYILGGGVDFKMASDHILSVGLFYKANFANTAFSVKNLDSNSGSSTKLNRIYDADKQQDYLGKYSIALNDWRNSNLTLRLSFLF